MSPFKDSSELHGKIGSGFGKSTLLVGAAVPAMFAVTDAAGSLLIKFLDQLIRRPVNPYRFGILLLGTVLGVTVFQTFNHKQGALTVDMFFLFAVMLQTMVILHNRTVRLGKIIEADFVGRFALLGGILALALMFGIAFFKGEKAVMTSGFGDYSYWMALSAFWLIPVIMFQVGLQASLELMYQRAIAELGTEARESEIDRFRAQIISRAKISFFTHFKGLILTISLTAAYGFFAGQI